MRTMIIAALLLVGAAATAQEGPRPSASSPSVSRREAKAAAFSAHIESLVKSRNYRFMPITMQNPSSGNTRNIFAYYLYFEVTGDMAAVHLPVEFRSYIINTVNFDSPVRSYSAEKVDTNWRIDFSVIHEGELWLVELFVSEVTGQTRLALVTKQGVMRYIGYLESADENVERSRSWGLF